MGFMVSQRVLDAMLRHPDLQGKDAQYIFGEDVRIMGSPTADQVHVPTAIGNTKGKIVAKARMDSDGDDTEMSKKKAAMGKVPPQFLPKQGGKMPSKGKAAKGKPFAKKK